MDGLGLAFNQIMASTWILYLDPFKARIFIRKGAEVPLEFCREIRRSKIGASARGTLRGFTGYVAEEMELACGCGTGCSLVLCGESRSVRRLASQLSASVRSKLRSPPLEVARSSETEMNLSLGEFRYA